MPISLKDSLSRLSAAATLAKTPVKVSVSIPLSDVKGQERHNVVATPSAFAKCEGNGLSAIKSVLVKSSVVKVTVSTTDENGDKATRSPDALPASVWTETYAK